MHAQQRWPPPATSALPSSTPILNLDTTFNSTYRSGRCGTGVDGEEDAASAGNEAVGPSRGSGNGARGEASLPTPLPPPSRLQGLPTQVPRRPPARPLSSASQRVVLRPHLHVPPSFPCSCVDRFLVISSLSERNSTWQLLPQLRQSPPPGFVTPTGAAVVHCHIQWWWWPRRAELGSNLVP